MRVLVIGGSGFIGTRLVDELLGQGHEVSIMDIIISEKFPKLTQLGDVRSLPALTSATIGIDIIYNLAAEHRDDVLPTSLYHEVNVEGAKNIVDAALANNVRRIVFTSTVAIYGLNKNCPNEEFPAQPYNEYGKTKWEAEKIFKAWKERSDALCLSIVRPAVVFGEGNRGNVYNLIAQIKTGRFIMIGDGKNKKSMGYVGNIAHFLALQTELTGYLVYNFCDKPDLTSVEIVGIIAKQLGKKLLPFKLPLVAGIAAGHFLDLVAKLTGKRFPVSAIRIKKFAAETTISTEKLSKSGFEPKYSITEGIDRMINQDFQKG